MTDIQWGEPIPAEVMKALGLPGQTPVNYDGVIDDACVWQFNGTDGVYRLPADHPHYSKHTEQPARVSDELVRRMRGLVSEMAPLAGAGSGKMSGLHYYTAKEILAELEPEPVDPLAQALGDAFPDFDIDPAALQRLQEQLRANGYAITPVQSC